MKQREPIAFKARDACWTVSVVDPLAGWLVGIVCGYRWITPNRVTGASVLTAALAAVSFGAGRLALGAVLFQLSFVLDCVDGKLAHARGQRDPLGTMIDVAADAVRIVLCAVGLAVAQSRAGGFLIGGVSFGAALTCLYLGVRGAVATVAEGRPRYAVSERARNPGYVWLAPVPTTILRHARGRSATPGTTVDTEAIAFTLGPLLGFPVVALLLAIGLDLVYAITFYARATRRAHAHGEPITFESAPPPLPDEARASRS